ncbi:hypothetical protein OG599_33225 [Streptomyces sp. NBC_01335]|uniref:RIFT barrel domain-containing protein n=1 Tax=Streptomyces sp. NBC_01335 TaxID=2903828 RepID=UPI002E13E00C|nr:hypothetical protein OG599_33225 [Streptomyces sp. NBC_01335]
MPAPARRTLLKSAVLAVADSPLTWGAATSARRPAARPRGHAGVTWGMPWARGVWTDERQRFRLSTADGTDVPVQSRPGHLLPPNDRNPVTVRVPAVLRETTEIPWISTNPSAQWALAAIRNLALIGADLPSA